MKNYDAVIIGAGPAGLNAGLRLISADSPCSILLVDKVAPWERPMPCAEGVGRRGLEEALGEIDPSWIRLVIGKATFYSPDGTGIVHTNANKGYIIDRATMQRDLTDRLKERGVEVVLGVKAVGVSVLGDDGRREVTFDSMESVSARVVIDASGPVSLLGKGEPICWKPYDLEPAYFAVAENVNCDEGSVHIYAGQKVAPGGYAWVFPRGGGAANIGVVIGKGQAKGVNIRNLLSDFLNKHYPKAEIITYFAGSISCGYRRGSIALPGLIKCGDAANAVNPISRAGIAEAFLMGALAGGAAAEMLRAGGVKAMKKICADYEKAWFKKRGGRHLKLARVKGSMVKVPDEDYNNATKALRAVPTDKLSAAKIFGISLRRFPRLAWALRHLM
ncbi:MAG: NAD(P)/FAD-dependent oxidoreductase [Chitinispirillales bacterium]|jgi:digeranylgeranylglycerophospholipid reductase|nr:NAD(P)/FAD-dependent oxidoreductase [Chitinispirillales bacterium]